jgi:hypothetical protein
MCNITLALRLRFTHLARKLYRVAFGGEQEAVDEGARLDNCEMTPA